MPSNFFNFKHIILKRKKLCAQDGLIVYSLAELVKNFPHAACQFFFVFWEQYFLKPGPNQAMNRDPVFF